jgi:hypothetical protein
MEISTSYIDDYGTQEWYINDRFHRTDGPAIIYFNGMKRWYLYGKRFYNNKSYQEAANITDEDMIAMILKYGDVK